jgi:glycosyltransferase involved in cell wall biosynthesis
MLMAALGRAGHEVRLASAFRAYEGRGDTARMERLGNVGGRLGARLAARLRRRPVNERPEVFFTYHLYDKAPDWIGPVVAASLRIPYVVAEATINTARAQGALAIGHRAALAALSAADAVVELNPADRAGVAPYLKPGAVITPVAPFIDTAEFSANLPAQARGAFRAWIGGNFGLDPAVPWLLAVGMMRGQAKLASYRVLGQALGQLAEKPWQLVVVGDGPAKAEVAAALFPLGIDRVRFTGALGASDLAALYRAADIFAWPAVDEAYGMALLEAQAAGLPAVAGASHGVGAILRDGVTGTLVAEGDATAFSEALAKMLLDPDRAAAMGDAAAANARENHDIAGAARLLDGVLEGARGVAAPLAAAP